MEEARDSDGPRNLDAFLFKVANYMGNVIKNQGSITALLFEYIDNSCARRKLLFSAKQPLHPSLFFGSGGASSTFFLSQGPTSQFRPSATSLTMPNEIYVTQNI